MKTRQDVKGCTLLVGANGSVGSAILQGLASGNGGRVFGIDRAGPMIRTTPFRRADITTKEARQSTAAWLAEPIDTIIIASGVGPQASVGEIIDSNYRGPAQLIDDLADKLSPKASVVAIGSISSGPRMFKKSYLTELDRTATASAMSKLVQQLGDDSRSAYFVSKYLLRLRFRRLAANFAHLGIRFNLVSPGAISGPSLSRFSGVADTRAISRAAQLVGEHVTPKDVADAVLFLVGSQSARVSGVNLRVDGGLSTILGLEE